MVLDIAAAVAGIMVPTLVILGDADRVEREEILRRELLSRVPQAEMVILPGVGHLSPLEAPDELARTISGFLARTGRVA
jgi:pimeloyl-ACP methyl ester carboxylesterase